MQEYIVGVDIGSSKVCAAIGRIDLQGRLQILGVTSVKCYGVKKSAIVDIDAASEGIKKCVQQLESMTDVEINEAYLNIPGGLCELINTKGVVAVSSDSRDIAYKDVERVLNAAKIISVSSDKEIIGILPEQYIVDGCENIKDPVGMTGTRLEVDAKAVVLQSTVINNMLKVMEVSGLNVNDLVLQPVALTSLMAKVEERNTYLALLNVGADTIDLSICQGDRVCYSNLIPLGGSTITNDIAKCLKITFTEAENIKMKFGDVRFIEENENSSITVNSAYGENLKIEKSLLGEIIRARVEELMAFVQNELKESQYFNDISAVMITGGGISFFRGITEFCREILKKPVKVIVPNFPGISNPEFSSAVGVVSSVYACMKPERSPDEYSSKAQAKPSPARSNRSNGFVSKIRDFIEEFF